MINGREFEAADKNPGYAVTLKDYFIAMATAMPWVPDCLYCVLVNFSSRVWKYWE